MEKYHSDKYDMVVSVMAEENECSTFTIARIFLRIINLQDHLTDHQFIKEWLKLLDS
jgi:hypothetical protein